MKKIVFTILILVALGGIGLFALNNNRNNPLKTNIPESQGSEHKVISDGDAYTPQNITIKKGDVILFENKSDKYFWPASNIHPTHGIYPEFDPKDAVAAGQSWSFKFDKSGTWRYHDHLYPYITGTITVE